jgi:hypothetical protein
MRHQGNAAEMETASARDGPVHRGSFVAAKRIIGCRFRFTSVPDFLGFVLTSAGAL